MRRQSALNIFFCIGILLSGVGCEDRSSAKETYPINEKTEETEKLLENLDPITSAVVVTNEEDIYAAAEVKHLARLRLESIRKESHSLLSKRWPNDTIHFSTDRKAIIELRKLNSELALKNMKKEEREKRLSKIEEHMKG